MRDDGAAGHSGRGHGSHLWYVPRRRYHLARRSVRLRGLVALVCRGDPGRLGLAGVARKRAEMADRDEDGHREQHAAQGGSPTAHCEEGYGSIAASVNVPGLPYDVAPGKPDMGGYHRRRFLMLVAIVVIAISALCLLHTHADGPDLCAHVLVIGGVTVMAALPPGWRFVPALIPVFPIAVLELASPPPRR